MQRHMIDEVFVIEIDKNGQILVLDFGCLEIIIIIIIFFFIIIIFFLCKTWSVGWFMFVPVNVIK